jgi:hypothetical protein
MRASGLASKMQIRSGPKGKQGSGQEARAAGEHHADPQGRHPLLLPCPGQVACRDADDEGGFDALAEHDEERNEHSGAWNGS